MKSFWQDIRKPILCLAPMDAVTDTVFRRIIAGCGAPDIFFTEFTNVEGLFSKGSKQVLKRFQYTPLEKPLIAQIWGLRPELFYKAAGLVDELGFDGIDINMGCPVHDVAARGACSGLIKNPSLAKEMILATQEGSRGLPISVKTRIGFSKIQTEEWISFLLSFNLDALIIHGRTAKEMSKVPAHWDEIGKVVTLKNKLNPRTVVIGNGDVMSLFDAHEKIRKYGVDGLMVGRGIFHNPWFFNPKIDPSRVSREERLKLLLEHTKLFIDTWGETKDFNILKKFYKIYVSGFDGASELRARLMDTQNREEVEKILLS